MAYRYLLSELIYNSYRNQADLTVLEVITSK